MNEEKLAARSLPQYRETSICEACGEPFTCGATLAGCWCMEISVSEEAQASLRERYRNCLCRACLENYSEGWKNHGEKAEQVFTGETD